MEGGDGVVLWATFWEKVSLLLTGTSLDELVEAPMVNARGRSDSEVARELQDQFDNASAGGSPPSTRNRSDSDLARQLQAEWNSPDVDPMQLTSTASDSNSGDQQH